METPSKDYNQDKLKFLGIQLGLFFDEDSNFRPDRLWKKIDGKLQEVFSTSPLMLPLPADAPPQFPLLQVSSSDDRFKLTAARSRADFFYNSDSEKFDQTYEEAKNSFTDLMNDFFRLTNSIGEVVRIGYVARYFVETKDPTKLLSTRFLKNSGSHLKLREVTLRFNEEKIVGSHDVNCMTNLTPAKLLNDVDGVLIERDINTLQTQKIEFNQTSFSKFISEAERLLSNNSVIEFLGEANG